MLVEPGDLRELFEPSGDRFQKSVTAIVLEEALSCGLNRIDVDADYRTNHADGGCDIFVGKGQTKSTTALIPDKPSIWSIKAGKNGIDPDKLSDELYDEGHAGLRQHLASGDVYFWCALEPAGQVERKAMRDRAERIAAKLGVDPELIRFVWNDHLCGVLNRYPNLIVRFLPRLYPVIEPMTTLAQWSAESPDKKGLKIPFVDLPGGGNLRSRIGSHLLGNSGNAVFHLAGLSGIGKTRIAIDTCLQDHRLADTLYVAAHSQISKELWRRLNDSTRVLLIIDEVPLEELTRLQDRFEGCGDRIRIVSIGPATRGETRRPRDPMLHLLEPPDETTGVLPVVSAAGSDLAEDVRQSIAHFSGHDLRLAILLVEATRRNGTFSKSPLRDYEDVWQRIMSLFSSQIKDAARFRRLYELLTLAVDIGHDSEHGDELRLLAAHFNETEEDLRRTIEDAYESGLGDRLKAFFEAKPRALAVWLFQEKLWPIFAPRLKDFVRAEPAPRLLRRFLERCHETTSPYREEVEDQLGRFFLTFLGEPTVGIMTGREASRVFQAWAEFDPVRGLAWLESAVLRATAQDLRDLTGDADGSGGWAGRRQIVWLCENLASFAEHFRACERILFILAQVETEVRIGNNSTNTWREMFLPIFAHTEVPFSPRLDLLKGRLTEANAETIELILSAFYGAIERSVSRLTPRSIVGGRIVPEEWKPETIGELEQCRLLTAKAALEAISILPSDVRMQAVRSIVEKLHKFLAYGVVDELSNVIKGHLDDESLKRRLLANLEEWLSWHEDHQSRPPWFSAALTWRDELSPATLEERIRDLTGREQWAVYRVSRNRVSDAEPTDVYSRLASEMLQHPVVVDEMFSWLMSPAAISAATLLFQLGSNDPDFKLWPTMQSWLQNPSATNLVANYLRGVCRCVGHLPDAARGALDELAEVRPEDAAHITLLADESEFGLRRVMAVLPRLEANQRAMLRQLSYDPWKETLSISEKQALLEQLCTWTESGDSAAIAIALDILAMWRHRATSNIPTELTPVLLRLADLSAAAEVHVDDYHWKELLEELAESAPIEAATLLAEDITNVHARRYQRSMYAQELFRALAKSHPNVAMQAIGKWVMDEERGVIFRLFEFRGLFDAIGLTHVKPWVEGHGSLAAVRLARHVDGPSVQNGKPVIPELADWLLTSYQHVPEVFREFSMGRHSGEMRAGHARDREAQLTAFLSHFEAISTEWVRKWIEDERASHRRDIEWDDEMEEKNGRV